MLQKIYLLIIVILILLSSITLISAQSFPFEENTNPWYVTQSWHPNTLCGSSTTVYESNCNFRPVSWGIDLMTNYMKRNEENSKEINIISPVNGTIGFICYGTSKNLIDKYDNTYLSVIGNDGNVYFLVHIKRSKIDPNLNIGSKVVKGQYISTLFEDGFNQDNWNYFNAVPRGQGRCAWASGTHFHFAVYKNNISSYLIDNQPLSINPNNIFIGKSINSNNILNENKIYVTTRIGDVNIRDKPINGNIIRVLKVGMSEEVKCKKLINNNSIWYKLIDGNWITGNEKYIKLSSDQIQLCN